MDARRDDLLALIPRLAAVRLAVLGDVFLDEYLPEVVRRTPLTSHGRFDRE